MKSYLFTISRGQLDHVMRQGRTLHKIGRGCELYLARHGQTLDVTVVIAEEGLEGVSSIGEPSQNASTGLPEGTISSYSALGESWDSDGWRTGLGFPYPRP